MKKFLSLFFAALLIISMPLTTLAAAVEDFTYTDDDLLVVKQKFDSTYTNQTIILPSWKVSAPNVSAKVSAKVDLSNFDTGQLRFYNYSKNESKLTIISDPLASLSKDNVLTFTTDSNQGFVVITDAAFALKTEAVAPATSPVPAPAPSPAPVENVGSNVYWVRNGVVYHSTLDCASLKRSSNIKSGTIAESGKPRTCKVCY